jgi:ribosome-binding ATPase YchF (GTP1/OBG family)
MKLSVGIVGLPNVGKSTLFKLLTKQEVNIANYPFATIHPNVGIVPVPDERLQKLAALSKSKKIIPAVVEFYDIAGLVKGAHKGEGLGNQFLAHIREVNAILQVVRCFKGGEIVHVEGGVDPLRDVEIIKTELILKDLETVEKRLTKAEADARSGKKEFVDLKDALKEIKKWLAEGKFLMTVPKEEERHWKLFKEMGLLTAKPQLYLLNGRQEDVPAKLITTIKETGSDYIIADLSSAAAIPALIKKTYAILNLISFFTTGEDETRAWTIERGTKAPQAAGVIHTDFEKKFIRAEVINWQKLIEANGWNEAKQRGWLSLVGKDYVIQDGDVIFVRHG